MLGKFYSCLVGQALPRNNNNNNNNNSSSR